MEFPMRKQNRLREYDYSTPGAYFLTICTANRRNLFWYDPNVICNTAQDVRLTRCGRLVDQSIRDISVHYPAVTVDNYVIMPNHVHLLLQIHAGEDGRPMAAPTIKTVINQMKGRATKRYGGKIWQKGFYDHIIRGEEDYREIWMYIEGNPGKWSEDRLYMLN